jgi:putative DNA primase/helicase
MDSHFVDLRTLHATLGGDITGNQVVCPGPGHSNRDRSLAVMPTASGGFVVHSFAGDPWQLCQDHVRERLGLPRWREQRHDLPPLPRAQSETDPQQNVERAKRLWDEGYDPRVPLVMDYLASRKLNLPEELCGPVLRFHPRCPWRTDDRVDFLPCLIAAFTSISDDRITAIHRVRLDKPERWPKSERKMLGSVRDSAVKLDPPGQRLAVAEGIESALAARQLGFFGATWALGSARNFAPVDGVNELIILGEHDAASRKATDACSEIWTEFGRKVFLALPTTGNDFNDYLMGAG